MDPPQRLIVVLWSCGPERPELVAAPFVYALAARALDIEVEMHFTAATVRWLLAGVADRAFTDRAQTRTVLDFIRDAKAAGVALHACAMALHEHRRGEALCPEADGIAGAATVIGGAFAPATRIVVF